MTGLLRWHFILENDKHNLIGEKNLLKKSICIKEILAKPKDIDESKVLFSPVGVFFKEFTPLFHITCEKIEGITRYILTDIRYYSRHKFLHHAILEIDDNNSIIKSSFNPYSMGRECPVPYINSYNYYIDNMWNIKY